MTCLRAAAFWSFVLALGLAAAPGPARAADPPALTLEVRNTAEVWRNLRGGISVGNTTLDKLQASAAFDGAAAGLPGLRLYAQVFTTNAESLSLARTGDIQTVSNIEAPKTTRLFELWAQQSRGAEADAGWVIVRAGLIDLNRTFDSISTAGLFINSSHGIGPDLSRSGVSGPSIFPVAGAAIQFGWRPVKAVALNVGVFAEPDPERQDVVADLPIRHGAVMIAQADWSLPHDAQVSAGVWRYSSAQTSVADPTRRIEPRVSAYGFVQGPVPLPGAPRGWVRAGFADGRVQAVAAYVGGGLVWNGPGGRRDRDQFGIALARAGIGAAARRTLGLPRAETTLEATYSFALGDYLHLQPDVQHIFDPAGGSGLRDATVIGLRFVLYAKWPKGGG
jgi:porin